MQEKINKAFIELCMHVHTIREVERICKVDISHISRIRAGQRNASLEQLSLLCKYLNATVEITLNPDKLKVRDSDHLTKIN